METKQFLANLNTADKGWGLWINKQNPQENHVGQYAFENDYLSKNFIHVGSLEELAHLRQQYILKTSVRSKNDTELGEEWAEDFLKQLPVQT